MLSVTTVKLSWRQVGEIIYYTLMSTTVCKISYFYLSHSPIMRCRFFSATVIYLFTIVLQRCAAGGPFLRDL